MLVLSTPIYHCFYSSCYISLCCIVHYTKKQQHTLIFFDCKTNHNIYCQTRKQHRAQTNKNIQPKNILVESYRGCWLDWACFYLGPTSILPHGLAQRILYMHPASKGYPACVLLQICRIKFCSNKFF
jgi:hypothetical protein